MMWALGLECLGSGVPPEGTQTSLCLHTDAVLGGELGSKELHYLPSQG